MTIRRRAAAAIVLSGLARERKVERRLARKLEEPFLELLEAARRLSTAATSVEAFLVRANAFLEGRVRLRVREAVLESGEESARQGYARTVRKLKRMGREAEDGPLPEADRRDLLEDLDREIRLRIDPLPAKLVGQVERLRSASPRSLRPWANSLARGLAKAASTYALVRGELAANIEWGTGYWGWVNVGDDRVRKTHLWEPSGVAGEVRRIGVMFSNGCRYPRDPLGPVSETAECRCHTEPAEPPKGEAPGSEATGGGDPAAGQSQGQNQGQSRGGGGAPPGGGGPPAPPGGDDGEPPRETPRERIERLIREGRIAREQVDRALEVWRGRLRGGVVMPNGETARITLDDLYHLIVDDRILRKPERIERVLRGVFEVLEARGGRRVALSRFEDEDGRELVAYAIIGREGGGHPVRVRTMHLTREPELRRFRRRGRSLWRRS